MLKYGTHSSTTQPTPFVFVLLGSEFPAVFPLVDLFSYTSLETFQMNKNAIFEMILEHVMSREDHFGLFQDDCFCFIGK